MPATPMAREERSVLREGVVAGLIGAGTVAGWFFVVDFARGRPLFTPALLGTVVFYGANSPNGLHPALATVLGYTLLHGLAFVAFGVMAASLIDVSKEEPPVFVAFVVLFAAFEVLFVGLVAAFSRSLLGALVWWSVLVANLLASATMLAYFFRRHPAYGERSPLAPVWFAFTIGGAGALAVHGIVTRGWSAISWTGAVLWGMVAAVAFLAVAQPLWAMTEGLDFLDLLGSIVVRPGGRAARVIGAVIHLIDGALLGIAWAYGTVVFESPQWGTGFVWGLILWALALIMLNTIGSVHPAIRRGEQRNPAGSVAKLTVLIPNIVYGAVLDGLYHGWRL